MTKLPDNQFAELIQRASELLADAGFSVDERRTIPFGVCLAVHGGGQINLYNGKKGPKAVVAGKFLLPEKARVQKVMAELIPDGEDVDLFPNDRGKGANGSREKGAASNLLSLYSPWIGCDESGKGDYFGPLVVAAVHVEPDQIDELRERGIRDSKVVTDSRAMQLSGWIEKNLPNAYQIVMPETYNERYPGNLNTMLADLHAETIRLLAKRTSARIAISDDFGAPRKVARAFGEYSREIALASMPKAEQDMGVAAASILARGLFLDALRGLSVKATIELPPGAGGNVVAAGSRLKRLFGVESLGRYAKLHFATTEKL